MIQLREIEEKLRLIERRRGEALDASAIGIWEWDTVTKELYWDDKMLHIYGIKRSEFNGKYEDWSSRLKDKDLSDAEAPRGKMMGDQKSKHFFRFEILRKGIPRWVNGISNCIRDDDGTPLRFVGINILEP